MATNGKRLGQENLSVRKLSPRAEGGPRIPDSTETGGGGHHHRNEPDWLGPI